METAEEGIWLIDEINKTIFVNKKMANILGREIHEMIGHNALNFVPDDQLERTLHQLALRQRGEKGLYDVKFRHKDGYDVWATVASNPVFDSQGQYRGALAVIEATSPKGGETNFFLSTQRKIFEVTSKWWNARGSWLTALISAIEALDEGVIGSVLLLDDDGQRILHGAAPGLPIAYISLVEGSTIGPQAGSCGTAMFRKELVIVDDTYSDPLWANYRGWAQRFHLRACWSSPILASNGKVLGTFAMYFREPREPDDWELQLIQDATAAAALSINHVRTLEAEERSKKASQFLVEVTQVLALPLNHEPDFQ